MAVPLRPRTRWGAHPPFPDPIDCDDAPTSAPPPEGCPDDTCSICLNDLDEAPRHGPLRGAGGRPLARLISDGGQPVCGHWFHRQCAESLRVPVCPLCRADYARVEACDAAARPVSAAAASPATPVAPAPHGSRRLRELAMWPAPIVVRIMACLRPPGRCCVVQAIPPWRAASQAPDFWEAQELQCFHEKTGPEEDVIGIGVWRRGGGSWRGLPLTSTRSRCKRGLAACGARRGRSPSRTGSRYTSTRSTPRRRRLCWLRASRSSRPAPRSMTTRTSPLKCSAASPPLLHRRGPWTRFLHFLR